MDGVGGAKPSDQITDDEDDEDLLATTGTHPSFRNPILASRASAGLSKSVKKRFSGYSSTPKQKPAPHRSREPPFRFTFEGDNNAKAAWRRRKEHNGDERYSSMVSSRLICPRFLPATSRLP